MIKEERVLNYEEEEGLGVPGFDEEEYLITEEVTKGGCAGGSHRSIPACLPCDSRVKFCCVTTLNSEFPLIENNNIPYENLRLLFNTSCLRCRVQPCEVTCSSPSGCNDLLTAKKYQVIIDGCIKYLFSALVDFDEVPGSEQICGFKRSPSNTPLNNVTEEQKVAICCEGAVCVNNPICITDTFLDAVEVCKAISPINCGDITLIELKTITHPVGTQFELCSNNHVIRFEAEILLPSCIV